MPYKLNGGVYSVRCRHPYCGFNVRFDIDQNIMGVSEGDVEYEARRLARDMAMTKHEAIYGMKHSLKHPEIRRVTGSFDLIGPDHKVVEDNTVLYREFEKGESILRKGDDAATICEVVRGSAFPRQNKAHPYNRGGCFGAAALLAQQNRTADIIAGKDGTRIAFYDVIALSKKNPNKAKKLYTKVMKDVFTVISNLEHKISSLEKKLQREFV
jgi:hypothetical protein